MFGWGAWDGGFLDAIIPVAITSLAISTVLGGLAGYGLNARQPWARTVAIIAAIWALIHPVPGTALGIYTLWVLAPAASGREYDVLTRPAQAQQPTP
jgi:ABC-type spermidine/putrescine transport system permease subunit II